MGEKNVETTRVVILAPNLSNNSAGRALNLAATMATKWDVEVWGPTYGPSPNQLWPPISDTSHRFKVFSLGHNPGVALSQLTIDRLGSSQFDLAVVSKRRYSSVLPGKIVRDATGCLLALDEDDNEWAFQKGPQLLWTMVAGLVSEPSSHRSPIALAKAQKLVRKYDLRWVTNGALARGNSTAVIPHAKPGGFVASISSIQRSLVRKSLGVDDGTILVVFAGTPRPHKGLTKVAKAIGAASNSSVRLLLYPAPEYKDLASSLKKLAGEKIIFSYQHSLEEVLSVADVIPLLSLKKVTP
jgi:hypothetical protein